jgi:hypothetical protein
MRYSSRAIVRLAAVPPAIDGNLDDAAWQGAATDIPFIRPDGRAAKQATTVFLAYDKTNLYVAARFDEPTPMDIQAVDEDNQARIRSGDHFLVHIVPDWRDAGSPQHQLFINSKGVMVTSMRPKTEDGPKVTAIAAVGDRSWTMETAIPLKHLDFSEQDPWGQTWGFIFMRLRRVSDAREMSAWTRTLNWRAGKVNLGYAIFKGVKPKPPKEAPKEPEKPTEPEEPTDPEKPAEPEEPADPEKPAVPEEPADPEKPAVPEEPADPEEPAEPEEPADPEKPAPEESGAGEEKIGDTNED